MNLLFQNAIQKIPQAVPPIWFMRQAGRYHSHYQKLRAKHNFMELCKIPELAAEVALGPIEDFDYDVSILFSDLLFPLEALGLGLEYTDNGPRLGQALTDQNIGTLNSTDECAEFMQFQKQAMILTRQRLPKNKSLIGFVGGLWTLFVYAVEGGHAGSLVHSKNKIHLYEKFKDILLPLLKKNIQLQLDGGAEVVMIFDTAAGEVSSEFFKTHLQHDLLVLRDTFAGKLGYYSKGTQSCFFDDHFTKGTAQSHWAGLGIDHRWNMLDYLKNQTSPGFSQGNFDQALLHQEPEDFKKSLNLYLQKFVDTPVDIRRGWVCGLGHGVLPKTPEKNVRFFVDHVRKVFST
jgi:uroporphyrinogen decarboxylase